MEPMNITEFRIIDTTTGKVILQTSLFLYFTLAAGENTPPLNKRLEAVVDNGPILDVTNTHIADGLDDLFVDGLKPVAFVPTTPAYDGFTVVPQQSKYQDRPTSL